MKKGKKSNGEERKEERFEKEKEKKVFLTNIRANI